jgi:hypothetical protein
MYMQVFAFSPSVMQSAEWLCDKHVVNQPRETVQILNTALHLNDAPDDLLFYKPTHKGHPVVTWAAQSLRHWRWVYMYAFAVEGEFYNRYDDTHLSVRKLARNIDVADAREYIDYDGWTDPPQAFSEYEADTDDTWQAYREYYKHHKQHDMEFLYENGRSKPSWLM